MKVSLDAAKNKVVIGNKYGYVSKSNSLHCVRFGYATDIKKNGDVTLEIINDESYNVRFRNYLPSDARSNKSTVQSHILFPSL